MFQKKFAKIAFSINAVDVFELMHFPHIYIYINLNIRKQNQQN